jgi:7-cyano-7-deazaguanine synthase
MTKALLLSGGIESTALAFWLRPSLCITVDYGQVTATAEVEASQAVASALKLEHITLAAKANFLSVGLLSGSRGTGEDGEEFWPFRNQLVATIAGMAIFERNLKILVFGTVAHDRRFADGTQRFFKVLNSLMGLQPGNIEIQTPAIGLTTEQLLLRSKLPHRIFGLTFSCHRGTIPCGDCPGCRKHISISDWMRDRSQRSTSRKFAGQRIGRKGVA